MLFVPSRPVWAQVYKDCVHRNSWRDQELIAVTRHTLELALSAMRERMSNDYYHNTGAAAEEIREVLRAHGDPVR